MQYWPSKEAQDESGGRVGVVEGRVEVVVVGGSVVIWVVVVVMVRTVVVVVAASAAGRRLESQPAAETG